MIIERIPILVYQSKLLATAVYEDRYNISTLDIYWAVFEALSKGILVTSDIFNKLEFRSKKYVPMKYTVISIMLNKLPRILLKLSCNDSIENIIINILYITGNIAATKILLNFSGTLVLHTVNNNVIIPKINPVI